MGWGIGSALKSFGRKFDDEVLHPTKEAVQNHLSKVSELPFSTMEAVLPEKWQGSWTNEWADLADPGRSFNSEYWEKPLQTFSTDVDKAFSVLPRGAIRDAGPQIAGTVLSVVNPFLGAGFYTAYGAGKRQEATDDFSWGDLAKDAAINFGTAAVSNWAKTKLNANALKTANNTTSVASPAQVATGGGGGEALGIANARAAASPSPINAAGAVPQTTSSLSSAANVAAPTAASNLQYANYLQAEKPSLMDTFKESATNTTLKATPQLANAALTQTLAPKESQPIQSIGYGFGSDQGSTPNYSYGDTLAAFGGNALTTPNPNGMRLGPEEMQKMDDRILANQYLQTRDTGDIFTPPGQTDPTASSAHGNRLLDIFGSTEQARVDAQREAENYNKYWGVMDSNPWLTQEQMQELIAYANDPEIGAPAGLPELPPGTMNMFKGMQPLTPVQMNLL